MTRKTARYLIALVALLSIVLPAGAAEPTAASLLTTLRTRMSAPAVECLFTINGGDGPLQGSALISGTKIAMTTPAMCLWFDGTTQWAYLPNNREVSISEPTADELLVSNPFAILCADASAYKARRLPDSKGMRRVELVPADTSAGIAAIELSIIPSSGWPAAVSVTFTDNRRISLNIDKIDAVGAKPDSAFRYNKATHPADEIIDLR